MTRRGSRFSLLPIWAVRIRRGFRLARRLGGKQANPQLNYDLESNWSIVRRIRDDLKRIRPGLYLGDGNLRRDDGNYEHILYFALEL
jgi:hypothetical protein